MGPRKVAQRAHKLCEVIGLLNRWHLHSSLVVTQHLQRGGTALKWLHGLHQRKASAPVCHLDLRCGLIPDTGSFYKVLL